jgi:hypothetical protein
MYTSLVIDEQDVGLKQSIAPVSATIELITKHVMLKAFNIGSWQFESKFQHPLHVFTLQPNILMQ